MTRSLAFVLALSLILPATAARGGDDLQQDAPPPAQPEQQPAATGNKFPINLTPPRQPGQADRARSGSLAIRALQGTAGAAPIANAEVEIELYHRGMLLEVLHHVLDEHGVVIIDDLPVAMGLQPLVKIAHADVTYQKVGDPMDSSKPHQTMEIKCYELTEEEPLWRVRVQHVMIETVPDGVQVTEVLAIENPSDRTWLGKMARVPTENGNGKTDRHVTTRFIVPEGAMAVSLGRGFHDWCCTTLDERGLLNHLPLMPGATEMIYAYVIPAKKGVASFDIVSHAPGGVEHLMVLAPADLDAVSFAGLSDKGIEKMGAKPVRMFTASNAGSGDTFALALAGLPSHRGAGAASFAKAATAVGGIVIVLMAAGLIFKRPAANRNPAAGSPTQSASLTPLNTPHPQ